LLGATVPLVGFGGAPTPHVHNGRIAYSHVGSGNRLQIYTMTATGRHRHRLTASHRFSSYDPAYSPGGKRIAFVRSETSSDIWTMNAASGLARGRRGVRRSIRRGLPTGSTSHLPSSARRPSKGSGSCKPMAKAAGFGSRVAPTGRRPGHPTATRSPSSAPTPRRRRSASSSSHPAAGHRSTSAAIPASRTSSRPGHPTGAGSSSRATARTDPSSTSGCSTSTQRVRDRASRA
jgi:hypothetical protein